MNDVAKRSVTVIGAGIVGTVCANYLLRDGHAVTLIDRAGPGEATSFGNTGGISPASVVPIAYPGHWHVRVEAETDQEKISLEDDVDIPPGPTGPSAKP